MAKSFRMPLGPFNKGLNNKMRADQLGPGEAQDGTGFDISDGRISAIAAVGAPIIGSTLASTDVWFYLGKSGLISSTVRQYALSSGSTDYATVMTSEVAASLPKKYNTGYSGGSWNLGIPAPTALSGVASSAGGTLGASSSGYTYAVTYVTSDGIESNPYKLTIDESTFSGANNRLTLTVPTAPSPNNTRVTSRKIYRTETGTGNSNLDGTLYLRTTIADNSTTSFVDSDGVTASSLDTDVSCYWGAGGSPDTPAMSEDHSTPPSLMILSNAMHSVTGGAGSVGSGIIFGAGNNGSNLNRVYWSMLGYPDYWPTLNYIDLPDEVEAIITVGADTYVFTGAAIYRFSGVDDFTVSMVATESRFGVRDGCGRSATMTRFGVAFMAYGGLALFDGSSSHIISSGKIDEGYLDDLVSVYAIGVESYYLLFHDSGTIVVDLRTFPDLVVSPHALTAEWAHHDPAGRIGSWDAGLYTYQLSDSGYLRNWTLREASGTPASNVVSSSFSLFSGNVASGEVDGDAATARFYLPGAMCMDSSGNIYVIDNRKLRKINSAGAVTTIANLQTTYGAATFYQMAAHADGNIYIVLSGGYIAKVTQAGVVSTVYSSITTYNYGIAIHPTTGDMYVGIDYGSSPTYIKKLSTSGDLTSVITVNGLTGARLLFDAVGNLYLFGGTSGIYKVSPSLTSSVYTASNFPATYISGDTYGNLYGVVGGDALIKSIGTSAAHTIATFYTGSSTISGIAISPTNDIYCFVGNALYKAPSTTPSTSGVLAWSWTTGNLGFGDNTKRKTWSRIFVEASGTISIGVYVDGTLKATVTGSSWLPDTCSGYLLKLIISSSDGTGVLSSVEIQGVINGT